MTQELTLQQWMDELKKIADDSGHNGQGLIDSMMPTEWKHEWYNEGYSPADTFKEVMDI